MIKALIGYIGFWECAIGSRCIEAGPGVGSNVKRQLAILLWLQILLWTAFLLLPVTWVGFKPTQPYP